MSALSSFLLCFFRLKSTFFLSLTHFRLSCLALASTSQSSVSSVFASPRHRLSAYPSRLLRHSFTVTRHALCYWVLFPSGDCSSSQDLSVFVFAILLLQLPLSSDPPVAFHLLPFDSALHHSNGHFFLFTPSLQWALACVLYTSYQFFLFVYTFYIATFSIPFPSLRVILCPILSMCFQCKVIIAFYCLCALGCLIDDLGSTNFVVVQKSIDNYF